MKKRRVMSMILSTVLIGGLFAGCSSNNTDSKSNTEKIVVSTKNGEVEVTKNPEKVVVLDYGSLDIMQELGVEAVGVPKNGLPEYLSEYQDEKYTNIGGVKEFDIEKINELEPDLIIIEGRQAESVEELSKIAPTIYLGSEGTDFVNSVKRNAETLGKIFGKEDIVSDKLNAFDTRIAALKENITANKLNALLAMVSDGSISIYGNNSRFNILFNELGFECTDIAIEVSNHGQSVTNEYLVSKNPNYLFIVDRNAITSTNNDSAKNIIENELIKTTDAYKNNNIAYLNPQAWYVGGAGLKSLDIMISDIEKVINK